MTRRSLMKRCAAATAAALTRLAAPSASKAASVTATGYAGPVTFGASLRPYQQSFWGTPLPDNAVLDPSSATVVAALAAQAQAPNRSPNVNVGAWTAEPIVVPASQPLVPVLYRGYPLAALQDIAANGLPIPSGWAPAPDSDAAGIFWQPDYVNPHDPTIPPGRYFETEGCQYTNGQWSVSAVARAVGVNADTYGHYGNWTASGVKDPADPDSTYQQASWGVQGSGLPYLPGVISYADCARGAIDHVVHLCVVHAAPGRVWPAQKSDGDDSTTPVVEGQRYRLAAGYTAGGVHPICDMLIRAVARYGLVVTDKTAYKGQIGNLAFRAAPSIAPFLNGVPSSQVLTGFPWSHLELLAVGSDSNPTPVEVLVGGQ